MNTTFQEQIAVLKSLGYGTEIARAKVAHDAILLAMHRAGLKSKSTVKGGVVMADITKSVRRATMDMDIDFIKTSISEVSVRKFIAVLQRHLPGVSLVIKDPISELKQADYRGKRVVVLVKDQSLRVPIRIKLDIGVHNNPELRQADHSFEVVSGSARAELQINPLEQIFAEKLLSLVRHGFLSTRPKDLFDMYFLKELIDRAQLKRTIGIMIYGNRRCGVDDRDGLLRSLASTFGSSQYMRRAAMAKANWLEMPVAEVASALLNYLSSL